MTSISTRLNQKESDYLTKIAIENQLFKGESKDISTGKAMRDVVKWCQQNNVDIRKNMDSMNNEMQKMIEQIHVAIPNIMYLSRLNILFNANSMEGEEISSHVNKTLEYLNDTCGGFQNVNYNEIHFSVNELGIKQAPIDKEKSSWKSR